MDAAARSVPPLSVAPLSVPPSAVLLPARGRVPVPDLPVAVEALPAEPFHAFFALSDDALLARGMRRVVAPENPGVGYPCRVSLAFASAGEELLLVNHRHLDVATTPYRAEGPIFVRRGAQQRLDDGTFPEIVMHWAMSIRAYDHHGMMVEADVAEKAALQALTRGWLARSEIAHVDIHSMRRGCFFCRVKRAAPDYSV